jgi:ATP-dependent phosphoenolpyruvate carboxykinase
LLFTNTGRKIKEVKQALEVQGLGFDFYQDLEKSHFIVIFKGKNANYMINALTKALVENISKKQLSQIGINQDEINKIAIGGIGEIQGEYTGYSAGFDPNQRPPLQEQIKRAKLESDEHNKAFKKKGRHWYQHKT